MQAAAGGLSPQIKHIRDYLERRLGVYYDSVLVNLYPDGKCGMRFHSDPLYNIWQEDSAIVSVGMTHLVCEDENVEFGKNFDDICDSSRASRFSIPDI